MGDTEYSRNANNHSIFGVYMKTKMLLWFNKLYCKKFKILLLAKSSDSPKLKESIHQDGSKKKILKP